VTCMYLLMDIGHAEVNSMRLYHEIHGDGDPLVLLPGGLQTIDEMSR